MSEEIVTTKESPADLCVCGDYRQQHDENGCKLCRTPGIRHTWEHCYKFELRETVDDN